MKLLVIRLSSFGDIAMTVPVVTDIARAYPQLEITVLCKEFAKPLFDYMPANVRFRGVTKANCKNFLGLFRLFRTLHKEGFDQVADLHDVLRSKVLRTLFAWTGARVAHIDKGRKGKRALTRAKHKVFRQLPYIHDLYKDVFHRLGYQASEQFVSIYDNRNEADYYPLLGTGIDETALNREFLIGIAPFAAHKGKILPCDTMLEVIERLLTYPRVRIFLFGNGRAEEKSLLEQWAARHPNNVYSTAGKLPLKDELALMSHLKVMIVMDSANMHLARLVHTDIVSVWGATHRYAGFSEHWSRERMVEINDLSCRPCSIFGNKPCLRGDCACLTRIKAEDIVQSALLDYDPKAPIP
ncbi:MAG: glycosyltransferase family 9 protein [Prevotellaceae bacterium]|jgi:ADP-heptose:LPS heptosyltransferase|nr:glycosyltransferase family 9 protein [Prevotellaceae bacterium]